MHAVRENGAVSRDKNTVLVNLTHLSLPSGDSDC
jgi:hypothetical protein